MFGALDQRNLAAATIRPRIPVPRGSFRAYFKGGLPKSETWNVVLKYAA